MKKINFPFALLILAVILFIYSGVILSVQDNSAEEVFIAETMQGLHPDNHSDYGQMLSDMRQLLVVDRSLEAKKKWDEITQYPLSHYPFITDKSLKAILEWNDEKYPITRYVTCTYDSEGPHARGHSSENLTPIFENEKDKHVNKCSYSSSIGGWQMKPDILALLEQINSGSYKPSKLYQSNASTPAILGFIPLFFSFMSWLFPKFNSLPAFRKKKLVNTAYVPERPISVTELEYSDR